MDAVHADLEYRALAGFSNAFLDFLLGFPHDLLDTAGMNATVGDQPLERDAGDLAADRAVT